MRKYKKIFLNDISTTLEYRGDLLGQVASNVITILSIVILWSAIFKSRSDIQGYNLNQTVMYYILMPFIWIITGVYISDNLSREIKDGGLSKHLLRPFNIWTASFIHAISQKTNRIALAIPLYALILGMFYSKLQLDLLNIFIGLTFAFLAFILHFFLDISISWLAFWIHDTWSFRHFKVILFTSLGGVFFPLDFIPENFRTFFELLPFKYLFYTPTSYILGKQTNILVDVLGCIAWIILFAITGAFLWRKGLRKYEAYGN